MDWLALTGVNGFIGHNLARDLLFPCSETYAAQLPRIEALLGIDLPGSEQRANHQRLLGCANYHYESGLDAVAALEERRRVWGSPPLAVLHNGACSSTTVTDPDVFRVQNLEASQALFRYCAAHGIPLLYASSASIYGDGQHGFSDRREAMPHYRPMNLYGQSKYDFDRWVLEQRERPPVWFGLRYFNVFGPFEEHKGSQASIFDWGRRQILESGRLRLYQSHQDGLPHGHQQRDFVSVHDVARVTWQLLKLAEERATWPQDEGCFVNVGRGRAATWLELGTALFEALDRPPAFDFIPMPESLRQHYQNFTQADLGTLHELGLRDPFLSLPQAFRLSLSRLASSGFDD